MGATEEAAMSDLQKIHQENVERLAGLSEAELAQEKEQIERTLSELVSQSTVTDLMNIAIHSRT